MVAKGSRWLQDRNFPLAAHHKDEQNEEEKDEAYRNAAWNEAEIVDAWRDDRGGGLD